MNATQLEAIGFTQAGTCILDPALKSGVRFALTSHKKDRVLYAFAVDGEIKYVGTCDNAKTCFASRMSRYQGIMGAGTNKRIVALLRAALANQSSATILVWRPEAEFRVHDLQVDLVKGLENPLISLAKPEWNIHSMPPAIGAEVEGGAA